jgi:hypothetical protein
MICRTQLAAMDHNAGSKLPQATTKDGKLRYKVVFPKQAAKWVSKPIKSHKNKNYVYELIERVVECCKDKTILDDVSVPDIPKNIASTPRPDKQTVIEAHRSRFLITY